MAEKKTASRAEKAVSNAKKKSPTASSDSTKSSGTKKSTAKTTSGKKTPVVHTEYEQPRIPPHVMAALISLVLFVLFVIICVNPDGALLRFVQSFILGMVGQAGFYFLIPALLYIFIINIFHKRMNVMLRSVCTVCFVFLSACIYHLLVHKQVTATGISVIAELYRGGIEGTTGGVICGGTAMLLRWACGNVVSFIICALAAVITLLGALQITIPSILRAIANRPRESYEDEDESEYIEPAAVVVNHIANKQIQHKKQRQQLAAQQEALPKSSEQREVIRKPKKQVNETLAQQIQSPEDSLEDEILIGTPSRGARVMSTIDLDIETPVAAAGVTSGRHDVYEDASEIRTTAERSVEVIPKTMPPLERNVEPPSFVMEKPAPARKQASRAPEKKEEEKSSDKVSAKDTAESAKQVAQEIAVAQNLPKPAYCFPPIDLLKRPARIGIDGTDEMRDNSRRLNETLASFNIDARITNVTRGPSVTRYEVELDKGVRLSKLTGCADDIALSLGASGVRIAAVPGKISIVGIEVPNRAVTTVSLREVIDSAEFHKAKSASSFSVGKDIGGNCIVGNISKMPHMLIAGTTGSGKSVCMNSIIISLLYKASPDDVKLIMVDPKMVELGIYNGIPHLLIPVVTDPKKAAGSLQWAVTEMMRRYKLMSDAGVRDLESYNSIVENDEDGQKMPQVVIIIDELADLMMVAAKEVEDSICRIAQMGRASGMHLVIATQRPSANVITGLMKANIPSRIAFSVASAMESRIILDTVGAEKLVGKGDMLYSPIGSGKPLRVQGCFVTDEEVEAVAGYVKENYLADYNQDVLEEIEKKARDTDKKQTGVSETAPTDEELDGDEMLPAAVDVILETGQASVSMLQRRLKLGYARAARIVDEMEEKGIVGPFQGSKPRNILITKEQWQAMKDGHSEQMGFDDLEDDFGAVPEELD